MEVRYIESNTGSADHERVSVVNGVRGARRVDAEVERGRIGRGSRGRIR